MKVPVKWLNEYVKIDDISVNKLADLFLNIGFEVEEIINLAAGYENIVAGRILEIRRHEKADKLDITSIDIGQENPLVIVTGAKNIKVGDIVPVALAGAVVSGGKEIKRAELLGVISNGMLCSGKELSVDNDTISGAEVDGILILPKSSVPGTPISEVLGLDDYVLDISVGSNRPDCNAIVALAREISVKLNRKVKMPQFLSKTVECEKIKIPDVSVQNADLCSRYYGNAIFDVKIRKSPDWLRRRLLTVGVRPINNMVDITNYVLLELGQPLHAFDFEQIEGNIVVRTAKKDENMIALNGTKYSLDKSMLLIADDIKPLAIAGVMGGKDSAISDATKIVFLETARFAKMNVRSTSRTLGLRSDSSARYERGVDYSSVDIGRLRALNLIEKLKVGKIAADTSFAEVPRRGDKVIRTSVDQINGVLGIKIPEKEIIRTLKGLGFDIEFSNNKLMCRVPIWRDDIDNFSDLAEEVIRFYGYDKITSQKNKLSSQTCGTIPVRLSILRELKNILCAERLCEIINFSFVGKEDTDKLNLPKDSNLRQAIKILNPLSEDREFMRTQLMSSMMRTLQLNRSRQNDNLGLFEISKVFLPKSLPLNDLPNESYSLCIGLVGKEYDFYYLKNIISNVFDAFGLSFAIRKGSSSSFHPGISADIVYKNEIIGCFGKAHPLVCKAFDMDDNVFCCEMSIEKIISTPRRSIKVVALPKYPAVERDLAVVVEEKCTAGSIIAEIKHVAGKDLEDVSLFDVYKGGQIGSGYKSMAFSLKFRSLEKTLAENEIQSLMSEILSALKHAFGAELR